MEIPNNLKIVGRYCDLKGWSYFTKKNYCSALYKFLVHYGEAKDNEHISDSMIADYLLNIPGRSSRCTAHSAIKLFFHLKGQPNKLKYIPYPEKQHRDPVHVNKEEFLKMISVCTNEKHRLIIALMFDTGLRVSEVINLRLWDIDRSNMLINVIQAKGRKDRKVKLTRALLVMIDSYLISYSPKEYLLNGQFELRYSSRSCQEIVKKLTIKAGIQKHFSCHKLRHGFGMSLIENDTTLEEIANQLGHTSTKTTQIYARINNRVIQRIESPLEQILRERSATPLQAPRPTIPTIPHQVPQQAR